MEMEMNMNIQPLGDQAILIELGREIDEKTNQKVRKISAYLDQKQPKWMVEYIPAFTTVTVIYNPVYITSQPNIQNQLPYEWVRQQLEELLAELTNTNEAKVRTIEIPVCYGGDLGPDLSFVAEYNGLTEKEVVQAHMQGNYLVYMIGFAPGFPYIGGMDEKIAAPRRDDPRLAIPAGSVGIAGKQTGVYPIETPGGWQIIGRTPLKLFQPEKDTPSLLQAGDRIKFTRISEEEYYERQEVTEQ